MKKNYMWYTAMRIQRWQLTMCTLHTHTYTRTNYPPQSYRLSLIS